MATIFEDNFNSYNDGDLNGQGSWTGHIPFDIQGVVIKEGAKAVEIVDAIGQRYDIKKAGSQLSEGKTTVYVRKTSTGVSLAGIFFQEDATECFAVMLSQVGDAIYYLDVGGWHDSGLNYVADHWYSLEFEWQETGGSNPQFRFRVDEGTWQGWYDCVSDWATGVNTINLRSDEVTGANTSYWDYIAEEPYVPVVGRSYGYIFFKIYENIRNLAQRIFRIPPLVNSNYLPPI